MKRIPLLGAAGLLAVSLSISVLAVASPVGAAAAKKKASTTKAPKVSVSPVATVAPKTKETLRIGAIPDVAPDRLLQINSAMATYLEKSLAVKVEYVPVADYNAAVNLFRLGDLDVVWFGGLTGVQARLQTPGAVLLAQRDIDENFHSVFIANSSVKIPPVNVVGNLVFLKGLRFTYGSDVSTSGRMMPAFFLDQAKLNDKDDFDGQVGFSGSHDKTIDLVQAGTFEAGALNEQVWQRRVAAGTVDQNKVRVIFRTPAYYDYHWIAGPKVDSRFGVGFTEKIKSSILAADADTDGVKVLNLLGGKKFILTKAENYKDIEKIGRKLGLIN
jgi:phosphonate transport system substrate-binding protein